ncbi:MAG: beta-lactamase family protein [Thermoanaerobaculia bacterium]|nr:beta-lactamase family protein [Thermoanaerobaculia bacterium]
MCAIRVDEGVMRGAVEALLDEQIAAGEFPGAAWAVRFRDGRIVSGARGRASLIPAQADARIDTIWDAASLTKPLVTGALTMIAADRRLLRLDEPVARLAPELRASPIADRITIADLLAHRAGFQAWYPLYAEGSSTQGYVESIARRPLRYWPGTGVIYSCLGFILLGIVLERLFDRSLRALATELLFEPLGLRDAVLSPDASMRPRIAPTEMGNAHERAMVRDRGLEFHGFREALIHGEVNDGNAFHLGGAAGNAGLFATAADVVKLASVWMDGERARFSQSLRSLAIRNHTLGLAENRGFGWLLRGEARSHPAAALSRGAFGHTGFTGCSIWCDPATGVAVALMTNRIHPAVVPTAIQSVRARLNALVASAAAR